MRVLHLNKKSKLPSCIRDVALIDLDRQILGVVGIIGQHSVFRNRRGMEKHRGGFFFGGEMDVSENSGFPPPNHPILIGCSIINHPFWGSPIFGNTQMGRLESPTVSGTKNRGIFSRVPFLSVWHIFLGRSVKFPGSNTVHPQNLTCQKTPYILKGIAFFQTLILDIHVISSSQGCC